MRRSLITGLLLAASACLANAAEYLINQEKDFRQQCAGMWSKKSWGGDIDPFISVSFKARPDSHEDEIVSFLIFKWGDGDYLGRLVSEDSSDRKYICDDDAVKHNFCTKAETGRFIVSPRANTSSIFTTAVNLKSPAPLKYNIVKTGYYCVETLPYTADKYEAVAVFQNAYGELPGSQIAKLPFYGGLTIVYALVAALWAFLYVQHRVDILPVQNYITAIIIFLIIEMLITWAFYDFTNNYGNTLGSKILMIIVAILNAGRNSFSFFLLLIVCMGYGVVKPTLGKTMTLVRGLAIAHFVFGVIYSIASLTLSPDSAGPIVLLVILPLAATLTAFYVWTLNSLNLTMKELIERKQNVKSLMYKRLWWVLLSSIIVIFVFFFLNSLTFASHGSEDFAPTHWKTRWFVLDGWLNLVYLVDMVIIAYIWRPTANNRRFAMSDELAQEDDGFEIASIGESEDDDLERRGSLERERDRSGVREYSARPSSSGSPAVVMKGERQSGNGGLGVGSSGVRRDSGEAIFSVGGEGEGSEDGWSEDEDKKKLTGRKRD